MSKNSHIILAKIYDFVCIIEKKSVVYIFTIHIPWILMYMINLAKKNTFFNAFITNTVAHAEHFTTSLYKDSCTSTIRRRDSRDSQTLSADRWRGCAFWQSAE